MYAIDGLNMTFEQREKQQEIRLCLYIDYINRQISKIYYNLLCHSDKEPWEVWELAKSEYSKRRVR